MTDKREDKEIDHEEELSFEEIDRSKAAAATLKTEAEKIGENYND